jgi:hypothetical protein
MSRLLDRDFKYIPSARTDITATWRRFGFKPTTAASRREQQRPKVQPVPIHEARALRAAKK